MQTYYPPTSGLETTGDVDAPSVNTDAGMLVLQPPKCSVYPQLPGDYYCVDCHCFVSSHGHVRGAHRNHHFLTIREAAELHVPAMKSWTTRCEAQLQKAEGVLYNLGNASRALNDALAQQERRIDAAYQRIVEALTAQRDMLKRQLQDRVATEQTAATQAWRRMDDLVAYYAAYLEHCAALLMNVPPVEAMDTASVLWSADVMKTSELLGSAAQVDDVWLPELSLPELGSHCTPDTVNALLHLNLKPFVGVEGNALPTLFDVRPFQFFPVPEPPAQPVAPQQRQATPSHVSPRAAAAPKNRDLVDSRQYSSPPRHPAESPGDTVRSVSTSTARSRTSTVTSQPRAAHGDANVSKSTRSRLPFSVKLVAPDDPEEASSLVIFNEGHSLTRRSPTGDADDNPEHLLVRADVHLSQPGVYGWQVYIDRMAAQDGASLDPRTDDLIAEDTTRPAFRVLAGIAQEDDPDGAGVVWDGLDIVGPVEGQVHRITNAAFQPREGTTLGFVLEMEAPSAARSASNGPSAPPAMLHCFHEEDYVTTIFLPAFSSSSVGDERRPCVWCPAVSVLSPQEQITVRALALAMMAAPAPDLTAPDGTCKPRASEAPSRPGDDGDARSPKHPHTPHRPTHRGQAPGHKEEYSPELREILEYTERMRRPDKTVAWL